MGSITIKQHFPTFFYSAEQLVPPEIRLLSDPFGSGDVGKALPGLRYC